MHTIPKPHGIKQRQRKYRWALWTGLALMVVGLGVSIALGGEESNMDASKDYPPIVEALLICLLAPLIEELAFRLWAVGKRWAAVVSMLLMTVLTGLTFPFWWVAAIVFAVAAVCLFAIRHEQLRVTIMVVVSSLFFSMLHFSNVIDFNAEAVFYVVHTAGFGLVACYLVLNHGLLWSILLHVANNSLAYAALALTMAFTTYHVETDRYSMTAKYTSDYVISDNGTVRIITGTPAEVACNLAWEQGAAGSATRLMFYYDIARSWKQKRLCFQIEDHNPTKPKDYWPLVFAMRDSGLVSMDTLYRPTLRLSIGDFSHMIASRPNSIPNQVESSGVNLWLMADALRSRMCMPVLQEWDYMDTFYITNFEECGKVFYTDHPDTADVRPWLKKHGLTLSPLPGDTTQIVLFKTR